MANDYAGVRQPSSVIVLGDPAMISFNRSGGMSSRNWWHDKKKPFANIVFADFHVEGIVMTGDQPDFQRGPGWTFLAR